MSERVGSPPDHPWAVLDDILRRVLDADVVFAIHPTGDPFTGWARQVLAALTEQGWEVTEKGRVAALEAALRDVLPYCDFARDYMALSVNEKAIAEADRRIAAAHALVKETG